MNTFVVRVYLSGADPTADPAGLKGVVEEISSGCQATFQDSRQLVSIIASRMALASQPVAESSDDGHRLPVRSEPVRE